MTAIAILCVFRSVCGDEDGEGRGGWKKRGAKWKAPVIRSLKECERGAQPSKQTLCLDFSLFIYAP